MTYRTKHITHTAQDTLGCECHLKWEWTNVLGKNQCQCCLEGGPLILGIKEFSVITGQGKRTADHQQELKIKRKH